jgi:hypothetical protein
MTCSSWSKMRSKANVNLLKHARVHVFCRQYPEINTPSQLRYEFLFSTLSTPYHLLHLPLMYTSMHY